MKSKLIEILSIQSESYNQWRVFAYIIRQCKAQNVHYKVNRGNIYITKGITNNYPCVIAHMDTVHEIVEDLTVIEINGNLTAINSYTMEQTGIGGDDKVGIFIALQCLEMFDNIKIAFFVNEEVGCEGSYNADFNFFEDCNFVLQCDRKGNSDFVTNACGIELSSNKFQMDISSILFKYGYKITNGLTTDVMALKEMGIGCSAANVSCGYYNPHCFNEFVNIKDVQKCLYLIQNIIYELGEVSYPHLHKQVGYNYQNYPEVQEYCNDCWAEVPNKNGLCKKCAAYYDQVLNYEN